jgi:hypothetical protein
VRSGEALIEPPIAPAGRCSVPPDLAVRRTTRLASRGALVARCPR